MNGPLLEALQSRLADLGRAYTHSDVAHAMRGLGTVVTDQTLLEAMEALRLHSTGAGPLEGLLRSPGVTDVVVNGTQGVFVDRGSGLEPSGVTLADPSEVRRLAIRLAATAGRRLDDAQPFVDGRLPDGTRLHAVLEPLATPGTLISLRVPARHALDLDELGRRGTFTTAGRAALEALVTSKVAFLVSGGTGSGKTTLLAALLGRVPPSERIVVVEDSAELRLDHPHWVRLEGRPPNTEGAGAITLTALVRQALRMRPDRVVLGEVRGAELTDLLAALNTGHEGGCGTIHANSVTDVPARLEALAALGGMGREACHAQVSAALRVVLQLRRIPGGDRQLHQVGLVQRGDDGWMRVHEAVTWDSADATPGPAWPEFCRLVGIPE